MFSPDLTAFREAVTTYFTPLAIRANASINKLADNVYEIVSEEFAVRIRYGIGHRKDVLVTLVPTRKRSEDAHDLGGEIGLGAIAKFSGEKLEELSYDTEGEYFHYVSHIAKESERIMTPYLLGLENNFEKIEKSIRLTK